MQLKKETQQVSIIILNITKLYIKQNLSFVVTAQTMLRNYTGWKFQTKHAHLHKKMHEHMPKNAHTNA